MKYKESAFLFLLLLFSGAIAYAEQEREIPAGGVPSTHPHYHHYVYEVKCIPDENFYQIDPSGGKYQPEEWRTEIYERVAEHDSEYGIYFNDQQFGKALFDHTCVLKNGITVNTLIDYDREQTYVAPPPPDGGSTKEVISLGTLISVIITAPNGQVVRYGFLGGGNHHTWGTKRKLTIKDSILTKHEKWKIGEHPLESTRVRDLNESNESATWRKLP